MNLDNVESEIEVRPTTTNHPLAPLTPAEIAKVVSIIQASP
jgi:Cu2+-containing amine oxidase